jgi:hypothetical protein
MSGHPSTDAVVLSDELKDIFVALRSKNPPVRLQGANNLRRYVCSMMIQTMLLSLTIYFEIGVNFSRRNDLGCRSQAVGQHH